MLKKGTQIRNILFESLNEREEPFFYLAPDIINSVSDANMDMNKGVFKIKFSTTDGRNMCLNIKSDSVINWLDSEIGENDGMLEFLKHFIKNSNVKEDKEDQENIEEIVDEYGDIMSDDDMPNNSSNSMIGKSKFGSDKAIQQTIPKSRRYYGDMGLGVITW